MRKFKSIVALILCSCLVAITLPTYAADETVQLIQAYNTPSGRQGGQEFTSEWFNIHEYTRIYCDSVSTPSRGWYGYYATVNAYVEDQNGNVLTLSDGTPAYIVFNGSINNRNPELPATRREINLTDVECDTLVRVHAGYSTSSGYKNEYGRGYIGAIHGVKCSHVAGKTVQENETASTCTENGSYDEVVYCSKCGVEMSRTTKTVPKLGHDYKATITEPTCTKAGFTTHTCSRCGDNYDDTQVAAKGHSWNNGAVTTPATCTTNGVKTYTCNVCSATKTETINSAGHTPGQWKITKEPTCTEKGTQILRCTVCKEILESKDVSATGHTPKEPVSENEKAATCTIDGSHDEVVYCSSCGAELSRTQVIDTAPGHISGKPVKENVVKPTFFDNGSYDKVTYCSTCGQELERESVVATRVLDSLILPEGDSADGIEYWSTDDEDFVPETVVYAQVGSEYKVTIPKVIVLSGITKKAGYYVNVEGDLAGCETVNVIPEETVDLNSNNKAVQTGIITQDKTAWTYSTLGVNANGQVSADGITAGKWSGIFYFNINMNKVAGDVIAPEHTHTPRTAVKEIIKNATCTEAGSYDEVVYCAECREELERSTKVTEALGHSFANNKCIRCNARQVTFVDNDITIIQTDSDEIMQPPATYTNYLMMIQTMGIYCHDFETSSWTNGAYLFTEEQRNYFEQSAKKELSLPNRGTSAGTYPANTGSYATSIDVTSETTDLNDYNAIFVVGTFNGHAQTGSYSQSGTAYVDLYNKDGVIKSFSHPIYLMNSRYYGCQSFGIIINLNDFKEQGIDLSECYLRLRGNATSSGGYTCSVHYYYPVICK